MQDNRIREVLNIYSNKTLDLVLEGIAAGGFTREQYSAKLDEIRAEAEAALQTLVGETELKGIAMHASDLARAVGLLEGLKHPDEYLTRRLKHIESQLTPQ